MSEIFIRNRRRWVLVRSCEVRVTKEVCPADYRSLYKAQNIYCNRNKSKTTAAAGGDDRVALKESAHLR